MLLEVEDLHVSYGKVEALKGVSLKVDTGEVVTLIGANGAGKTTTLKTISGLRRPSAGRVRFDGQDITGMAGHRRVVLGLCQAPEGRGIFPGMTVQENLEMGTYARGRGTPGNLDRVLELFPRLAERRKQSGGTLSGGEQQMLAMARALGTEPAVLLIDELSMGLAPIVVEELYQHVTNIAKEGLSILIVEQFAHEILGVADVAGIMLHGRIQRVGSPAKIAEELVSAYLGTESHETT
jgi:branched-chain amino acid transport system ATP-binding protein